MEYTVKQALDLALNDARDKLNKGKLIPSDLWKDDEHSDDCETVYSLISLYSDDENNDGSWGDVIEEELRKIYPEYF